MAEVPEQLRPFLFKKGWKGGPGRKKGKSLKEFARIYLSKLTDKDKIEFLNSIDPDLAWRMAEGNPHQTEDITSAGKPLPQPIYGGLSRKHGAKKTLPTAEEDS